MKKIKIFLGILLISLTISTPVFSATLTRQLQLGMSGSDVSALQTFLARDISIYPQGLITGYFGSLTRSAVMRFQIRNGIAAVGRVGPITLNAINAQMNERIQTDPAAMLYNITINSSTNSATVNWNTNESTTATVYYNTVPLSVTESYDDVFVNGGYVNSPDSLFRTSHNVNLPNLQSRTTYYYMIYVKDASGNVTVSWPSTFVTR